MKYLNLDYSLSLTSLGSHFRSLSSFVLLKGLTRVIVSPSRYSFLSEFRLLSYHLTITIFRTPAVIPSFTRSFHYSLFTRII
jgi:hypothetical protein